MLGGLLRNILDQISPSPPPFPSFPFFLSCFSTYALDSSIDFFYLYYTYVPPSLRPYVPLSYRPYIPICLRTYI